LFRERYHAKQTAIPALVAAAVVVAVLTRMRPFRVVVDGPSMAPTLLPGDVLMATASGTVRPGAVVVVEHPARAGYEMVKRVAATGGQSVDGVRLSLSECWVVGDDPEASTDSRTFGPVPIASVAGVVRLRCWPPRRVGRVR
jgi:inner membrane protease subunit 1